MVCTVRTRLLGSIERRRCVLQNLVDFNLAVSGRNICYINHVDGYRRLKGGSVVAARSYHLYFSQRNAFGKGDIYLCLTCKRNLLRFITYVTEYQHRIWVGDTKLKGTFNVGNCSVGGSLLHNRCPNKRTAFNVRNFSANAGLSFHLRI